MADSTKKFLDYSGVSVLWSRIKDKIAAEEARAKAAEEANAAAAAQAQSDIDALETYVGTFPTDGDYVGTTSVIDYVNRKVVNTLEDATGGESAADVKAMLEEYISSNDVKMEQIPEIYATKTELNTAKEDLQTQINTIMNNPDTEGVINSINEFTQYIEDHGEVAEGFRTDIDKNKEDIAALNTRTALPEGYTTIVGYVDEKVEGVETNITNITENITNIEQKLGLDEGDIAPIAEQIATAKSEAISESKGYTDNAFNNIPALSESEIDAAIAAAESAS